jgi:hypothetical protein
LERSRGWLEWLLIGRLQLLIIRLTHRLVLRWGHRVRALVLGTGQINAGQLLRCLTKGIAKLFLKLRIVLRLIAGAGRIRFGSQLGQLRGARGLRQLLAADDNAAQASLSFRSGCELRAVLLFEGRLADRDVDAWRRSTWLNKALGCD